MRTTTHLVPVAGLAVLLLFSSMPTIGFAEETNAPVTNSSAGQPLTSPNPEEPGSTNLAEPAPAEPAPPASPTAEADSAAATAAILTAFESLSARLSAMEQSIALQQRVLEVNRETNRTTLMVAACFAAAGFLGILLAALILAKAVHHFSEVMAVAPARLALPPTPVAEGLAPGEVPAALPQQVEQVTARFLGAIEQLEKRIGELERSTQTSFKELGAGSSADASVGPRRPGPPSSPMEFSVSVLSQKQYPDAGVGTPDTENKGADQVALLLGKGQALLNLGRVQEALDCFDQALELNPANADALVKRGMTLERLEKMEAALESYDRAIAANSSMTLAYLYKGAVCNRLQRFREALECYENALKSEQKLAAS